MTISKQMHQDF